MKNIMKFVRFGLLAGFTSFALSNVALADDGDDVNVEDTQSYSTQDKSQQGGQGKEGRMGKQDKSGKLQDKSLQDKTLNKTMDQAFKERNINIDVARDLTVTKSSMDSRYKLPSLPQYTPAPLVEEAKGIAVLNGIPLNCKLLGEAEGIDSSDGKSAPSFEQIREGSLNVLRNKTIDLVDSRDRIVLVPVKEAMTCEIRSENNIFDEKDCTTWTQIPSNGKILFYRIHANVFDCGAR